MIKVNEWIDYMWAERRMLWYGLVVFGIASTVLAWHLLPWAWFEALLDPVIVIWMIYETAKRLKNK